MNLATNKPFESKYGFKSNQFYVDENGNIVANTITLANAVEDNGLADFIVTDDGVVFEFDGLGDNPEITLTRGRTYTFKLNLTNFAFYIRSDSSTAYNNGLVHSTGGTGSSAQGKQSGTLAFTVPLNAPDELFYSNGVFAVSISIIDAIGLFSSVTVNGTTNSTSTSTGSVIVAGGVGIEKDLHVGGSVYASEFNLNSSGITKFSTDTNLIFNAGNEIAITIDNVLLGKFSASGQNIPVVGTSINNTVIGNLTPSTATFVSAVISETPATGDQVTNKRYVDNTATAIAIAFGL